MNLVEMFAGEQAQLVPAGVRGYRNWGLTEDGHLASTGVSYIWSSGRTDTVEQAACLPIGCFCRLSQARTACPRCPHLDGDSRHTAPQSSCRCGFYGWYDPADSRIVSGGVFGAIEATGPIVLGAHGFRAGRARVLGVVVPPGSPWAEVAAGLTCPIFTTRAELLEAFPPDDLSGLVDHTCGRGCTPGLRLSLGDRLLGYAAEFYVKALDVLVVRR